MIHRDIPGTAEGRQRRCSNPVSSGLTSSQLRGAPCKALLAGWAQPSRAAGQIVPSIYNQIIVG